MYKKEGNFTTVKKKKHTSLSLQGRSGGQGWGEIDQIDQIPSGHPSPQPPSFNIFAPFLRVSYAAHVWLKGNWKQLLRRLGEKQVFLFPFLITRVAGVSVRSMSKERGTRVKDRAENVATKRGGKGVGKKGRKRLQPGGGGMGGYSIYLWVGRCGPTPHTLTDPDPV